MNLISCGCCGTMLDKGRIHEEYIWMEDQNGGETANPAISAWNRNEERHEYTINCPACESRIFYSNGDEVY